MSESATPRILVIGAHPDDCEVSVGGSAALWSASGAHVTFVSVTDGSNGHQERSPDELVEIRRREAMAAGEVLGVDYEILSARDGHLEPTLDRRLEIIRLIRRERPDVVITHRPVDYHPDHRYTSFLVQDSAYMVTVPHVAPDTPHLATNPVFAYMEDRFTRPAPLRIDVVVDIDAVVDRKWAAIRAHESQFFEWLPYNQGILDDVPPASDPAARQRFLQEWVGPWLLTEGDAHREKLIGRYGRERGEKIARVEVFEISEYGRQPRQEELNQLFPR